MQPGGSESCSTIGQIFVNRTFLRKHHFKVMFLFMRFIRKLCMHNYELQYYHNIIFCAAQCSSQTVMVSGSATPYP